MSLRSYCTVFLCVVVNAQILLKEVDPENWILEVAKALASQKSFRKPRKMRGFGDSKREEVTGLALSADGMKIYWSLAVNSLLFQRHMCHVDIMQDMYRYVPWQTLSDIFISKEQV